MLKSKGQEYYYYYYYYYYTLYAHTCVTAGSLNADPELLSQLRWRLTSALRLDLGKVEVDASCAKEVTQPVLVLLENCCSLHDTIHLDTLLRMCRWSSAKQV